MCIQTGPSSAQKRALKEQERLAEEQKRQLKQAREQAQSDLIAQQEEEAKSRRRRVQGQELIGQLFSGAGQATGQVGSLLRRSQNGGGQ